MDSYIRTHVNRTGRWIRKHTRGNKEERPEQVRVGEEIMQFLVKRETSLADAVDALTALMLNVLGKLHGEKDEFDKLAFRFSDEVSRFLQSTERDRTVVGAIPVEGPRGWLLKSRRFTQHLLAKPRVVTIEDRPQKVRRLAIELGETMTKFAPSDLGVGLNVLIGTMLTAIEATCGRERADEFDLLVGEFSRKMQSLPVGVGVKGGIVWRVNEESIARVEQNLARLHPGEQLVVVYQDVPPKWTTYSVTMTPQNEEATLKSLSADSLKLAERKPTHRAVIVFRSRTDEPAIWSYLKKLVADAAGHNPFGGM